MSSTLRRHPSVRRFSQVYVEIPPSPLSRSRNGTLAHVPSSTILKENAPLWTSDDITHPNVSSPSIPHKRKLSDCDPSISMVEVVITKKPKQFPNTKSKESNNAPVNAASTTRSEDFPNGFFYCHQCARKRDVKDAIYCTNIESHTNNRENVTTQRPCRVKYCVPCLKNRYGEDANDIKATKKVQVHVQNQGYSFKCPKCRDICNCARCRKAKGLEPTGNLHVAARKAAAGSTADINAKAASVANLTQVAAEKKPKAVTRKVDGTVLTAGKGPRMVQAGKPKPLPVPKWTKVPVSLTLTDAESRILIREFVIRFAQLMDIARGHVEELEDVGGKGKGGDEEELCAWVSEPCVKTIVLGLLRLLADDQDGSAAKIIKGAIKDIRGSGANLNKMWSILASMRVSLGSSSSSANSSRSRSSDFACLVFPDPLPPPASSTIHHTRNTRNGPNIYVTDSAQMVPLLEALTEAALGTAVVREEIEAGMKEGKERMKELKEILKKENDRWDVERKAIEEKERDMQKEKKMKAKHATHKQTLRDLEHALKVVMSAYAPRFGPLGRDNDGRVYWALSPSIIERERASEVIAASAGGNASASGNNQSKKGKGRGLGRTRGVGERSGMKEWSWFIGVWGKRPPLVPGIEKVAAKRDVDDSDSTDDDDEDVEQWWGFWQPEEIRKVAGWIAGTSGLAHREKDEALSRALSSSDDASGDDNVMDVVGRPTKDELRALARGLDEYAGVLEWRVKRQEDEV